MKILHSISSLQYLHDHDRYPVIRTLMRKPPRVPVIPGYAVDVILRLIVIVIYHPVIIPDAICEFAEPAPEIRVYALNIPDIL